MSFHILLDDVTTNVNGTAVYPQNVKRNEHGIVQIKISGGTVTVKVQGRTSSDMDWYDILSTTSSTAERVSLFPQMRAITSSISGATVRAELVESA